jgi:23S rRNA (cytidine1920-2'-O)/16S rRNA (cytidine1409-2'-O)-methyltransferase
VGVMRRRLDAELVRRGLADSREVAQRAIKEGRVLVSGTIADKPARLVDAGEPVRFIGDRPRFVSRGGEKLSSALDRFGLDPRGLAAFDAGASTGGFTDCLLQRGATQVVAVDVGFGQLHERIRADARVEVHEHVNLRTVDVTTHFGARDFPLVVGDLSFISLVSLADNLLALCRDGGSLVLLVKPQFEAGRVEVARGRGVIRDPQIWDSTLRRVVSAFLSRGSVMMGAMTSAIKGTDGNVEFLVHFCRQATSGASTSQRLEQSALSALSARLERSPNAEHSLTQRNGVPLDERSVQLIDAAVAEAVARDVALLGLGDADAEETEPEEQAASAFGIEVADHVAATDDGAAAGDVVAAGDVAAIDPVVAADAVEFEEIVHPSPKKVGL